MIQSTLTRRVSLAPAVQQFKQAIHVVITQNEDIEDIKSCIQSILDYSLDVYEDEEAHSYWTIDTTTDTFQQLVRVTGGRELLTSVGFYPSHEPNRYVMLGDSSITLPLDVFVFGLEDIKERLNSWELLEAEYGDAEGFVEVIYRRLDLRISGQLYRR